MKEEREGERKDKEERTEMERKGEGEREENGRGCTGVWVHGWRGVRVSGCKGSGRVRDWKTLREEPGSTDVL